MIMIPSSHQVAPKVSRLPQIEVGPSPDLSQVGVSPTVVMNEVGQHREA